MTSMNPNIRYDAVPQSTPAPTGPPTYRVLWPCILVKNRRGAIDHHYPEINPLIPWMSEEQATMLLEYGAIERIGDAATEPTEPADAMTACRAALDQLGMATDCGAPTAREALRSAGHRFGNDTIAEAVKARKADQPEGI